MAYTESTMMALGSTMPTFQLLDTVTNAMVSSAELQEKSPKGLVVIFTCNHCPYVIHVNATLLAIAREYMPLGVGFVAISSNDVSKYTEDAPDKMSIVAKVLEFPYPYLYDESQEVAKAFDAACTPDIYVFDAQHQLYYRGRIDASRPKNDKPKDGADLRDALEKLLANTAPPEVQYPSGGCGIKWKESAGQ